MKINTIIQKQVTALLLSAFVFLSTCNAQLWNSTYISDRPIMFFSSVIQHNQGYFVAGGTINKSGLNFPRAMFAQIDEHGSIANYRTLHDSVLKDYWAFYNSLILDNHNNYYHLGHSMDTVSRLLLLKYASNGTISSYEYETPNTYAFQGYSMLQYDDNSYYLTGVHTVRTTSNANVFLVKVDSNGNRIWEKYYDQYKLDYAKKIIKLANGNMMLGAVRANTTSANSYFNSWLIEVDTGGNVVRQWFDDSDSTFVAEGLIQTSDGGFVYGAQKKAFITGGLIAFNATIVRMDSSFDKKWTYLAGIPTDITSFIDLELLIDGSIIACGRYSYRHGWIVKLNAQGAVVWDKKYVGMLDSFSQNILTDVDVLPDGSIIAVGQCQNQGHTPPQVGWFLKLDSNGCEIENCIVGIDEQMPTTSNLQLNIYTNPFTSDISIALTGGHVSTATYTITNLTGQAVYHQTENNLTPSYTKMLDLGYLPNGVYFVEVTTGEGKMVERVIKQ